MKKPEETIKIENNFIPKPGQSRFMTSKVKYQLANGGLGSGKSSILSHKAIKYMLFYPGTTGLIARRTYPELRTTTRKTFFDILMRYYGGKALIAKWNQTENYLKFINGSDLYFMALDDMMKIGSLELGFFGIDELSEFETPEVWDGGGAGQGLTGRLRHPKGPLRGFGATNPATKEHWLYKYFVERQDPDYGVFEMPSYENRENLPEEYIRSLEKMPEEWRERYLLGKWGIVPKGTRVYAHFTPKFHIGDFTYNSGLPLYRSWDFGFRHPAVLFAQEGTDGRFYFLKEILGTEILINDFRDLVIKKTNEWFPNIWDVQDFCDPAGNQRNSKSTRTDIQILGDKGIRPKHRITKIEEGILSLEIKFQKQIGGKSEIGIDSKGCPIFIDALAGGYYRDKNGEPNGDEYFDHFCDCARYMMVNLFGVVGRKYKGTNILTSPYPTLSEARFT